jgi:hypothetical protein
VYRVQMGFSVLLDGRVWSTPYRLPHVHTVLEHTAGDSTHMNIYDSNDYIHMYPCVRRNQRRGQPQL